MRNLLQLPFMYNMQEEEVLSLKMEEMNLVAESNGFCQAEHEEEDLAGEEPTNEDSDRELDEETNLPIFTLDEVSFHDNYDDCWIVLYDKVYDITKFLHDHPGGDDVLMEHAGRDATIAFRSVGHSTAAIKSLEVFLLGILPDRQRMFPTDSENRWSII